jgi:hypothetical protein
MSTQAAGPADGRSLGEIVSDIAQDLTSLMRQELQLAKTEAKTEVKKAGTGAGLLGAAGLAAHLLLLFLSAAVMFALGRVMDLDWAALIVAAFWAVVAAVLAVAGRARLRQVDPRLETTTQTLKEDVRWAKTQSSS